MTTEADESAGQTGRWQTGRWETQEQLMWQLESKFTLWGELSPP